MFCSYCYWFFWMKSLNLYFLYTYFALLKFIFFCCCQSSNGISLSKTSNVSSFKNIQIFLSNLIYPLARRRQLTRNQASVLEWRRKSSFGNADHTWMNFEKGNKERNLCKNPLFALFKSKSVKIALNWNNPIRELILLLIQFNILKAFYCLCLLFSSIRKQSREFVSFSFSTKS